MLCSLVVQQQILCHFTNPAPVSAITKKYKCVVYIKLTLTKEKSAPDSF